MPIHHGIWKMNKNIDKVKKADLKSEDELEKIVQANPEILNENWIIIGRQVLTEYNKYIDLLAIDNSGSIIIIELKKNKTSREVVAQGIDYASWIKNLEVSDISEIYMKFDAKYLNLGKSLDQLFYEKFGYKLEEEDINNSHQIVIVASKLDSSTERIINYLNDVDIPINAVFFNIFQDDNQRYLSRAWMIDPFETSEIATTVDKNNKVPWNGEYYASFGEGKTRCWQDAMKYGFISGGGGEWYSRTLNKLEIGDRVWVNVPGDGYVGVGLVTETARKADEAFFAVEDGEKNIYQLSDKGNYHQRYIDDEDKAEYIVKIDWQKTVSKENVVWEVGFFGNQNTVCQPKVKKWNNTIDRLKKYWNIKE